MRRDFNNIHCPLARRAASFLGLHLFRPNDKAQASAAQQLTLVATQGIIFTNLLLFQEKMKALIIDDHPLFRAALVHLVDSISAQCTVVQAGTAESGIKILRNLVPPDAFDLVLLDLNLPELSGIEAVQAVVSAAKKMPVVVVSANEKASDAERIVALGARGYLLKSLPPADLTAALKLVLAGGTYRVDWLEDKRRMTPAQTKDSNHLSAVRRLTQAGDLKISEAEIAGAEPLRPDDSAGGATDNEELDDAMDEAAHPKHRRSIARLRASMSERQFEVLVLLCQGLSNRDIGDTLQIAESTVKVHLALVFRAIGVVNRTQAAVEARKMGLKF